MSKGQMDFYQGRLAYARYLLHARPEEELKFYLSQFTVAERGKLEADLKKVNTNT